MTNIDKAHNGKKIMTIPNLLSFIRLCLIPVFVWQYRFEKNYSWSTFVLILSAMTDIADGMIARKFHMVSDFGKALDPVVDKLTQIVTLYCLVARFQYMTIPLVVLVIKEVTAGITSLVTIRRTKNVMSADWHGKITTSLLYATMILHILWWDIPNMVSNVFVLSSTVMMLISAVLYGIRNVSALSEVNDSM